MADSYPMITSRESVGAIAIEATVAILDPATILPLGQ